MFKQFIHSICFLLILFSIIQNSSAQQYVLPESFKDYNLIKFDGLGELYASPNLEILKSDKDDQLEYPVYLFKINNKNYAVSFSLGNSDDLEFLLGTYDDEWEEFAYISGAKIIINRQFIYSVDEHSEFFHIVKKYLLDQNRLVEIKQPFLAVDKVCNTTSMTELWEKSDNKGTLVAKLAPETPVNILLIDNASLSITNETGNYNVLVSTPLGLVGWVNVKVGFREELGEPIGCIQYQGD